MQIKITCQAGDMMSVDDLSNFQGNLKEIDSESFAKLKQSIIKYGFSFPIFVWGSKILDGHQRLAAVKSLLSEGYEIDGRMLPVDHIEADSEQQAAEKLLLINSRYAKMSQSGFDAFISDFEIDLSDFSGLLEIPEIEFDFGGGGDDSNDDWIEKDNLLYKISIDCDDEKHQISLIEQLEELGLKCRPLIL